jgi:peroxiredoxin family protein
VETYVTGLVTDVSGVAAVVLTATIGLGLAIFLVFWGLNKLKGAA